MTMKKQLILAAALLCAASAAEAQDLIVKRNAQAEEIPAKVIEVGKDQIRYRKFSNPEGPIYTISRSEVFFIRYENGEKEVITAYDAPDNSSDNSSDKRSIALFGHAARSAASRGDASHSTSRNSNVLRQREPLRDRSWELGLTPAAGFALVFFEEDSWSGPAISVSLDGNYYFSKYASSCIGASLGFYYSSLSPEGISGELSKLMLDLYYGSAGSQSGSTFGYKFGFSLGFPMSMQMGDYDMTDSLNGFMFGTFTQLGWTWKHSDLGLRLQYDPSNLFKEVDSSMFHIGLYYTYRF